MSSANHEYAVPSSRRPFSHFEKYEMKSWREALGACARSITASGST